MTVGEIWTVRRGAVVVLGTIEISGTDFPWVTGTWSPSAAFAEVKPLFDRELELLNEDEPGEEWERAYRSIERADVRLFSPDDRHVPEFLLHIDGTNAWFRWHDEPFPEDDIGDRYAGGGGP